MDLIEILEQYPIPTSVVTTMGIIVFLNTYVFPHFKGLPKWIFSRSEARITDLEERIGTLQKKLEEQEKQIQTLQKKLNLANKREERLIGILTALDKDLRTVDVDIKSMIKDLPYE